MKYCHQVSYLVALPEVTPRGAFCKKMGESFGEGGQYTESKPDGHNEKWGWKWLAPVLITFLLASADDCADYSDDKAKRLRLPVFSYACHVHQTNPQIVKPPIDKYCELHLIKLLCAAVSVLKSRYLGWGAAALIHCGMLRTQGGWWASRGDLVSLPRGERCAVCR